MSDLCSECGAEPDAPCAKGCPVAGEDFPLDVDHDPDDARRVIEDNFYQEWKDERK